MTFSDGLRAVQEPVQRRSSRLTAHEDCNDISADFGDTIPYLGSRVAAWSRGARTSRCSSRTRPTGARTRRSPTGSSWSPRPTATPRSPRSSPARSDFIFPQAFSGITEALTDPNIYFTPGYGTNYEGLYFQQQDGPFADDDFRTAFAKSIDRDADPRADLRPDLPRRPAAELRPVGADDRRLVRRHDLQRHVRPRRCASRSSTDAGWTKNADGIWANSTATVPEIRWIVNTGNTRRESTQALMIPELQPQPASTSSPTTATLPATSSSGCRHSTTTWRCTSTPPRRTRRSRASWPATRSRREENGNQGQNSAGWCNEEASALMIESDQTSTRRLGSI